MPTHNIHLAIAKKVNDRLNMNLDEIMLGSILPDLSIKQDHKISHFQHGEKDLEGLSNPDLLNPVLTFRFLCILQSFTAFYCFILLCRLPFTFPDRTV